ncbi:MAG: hypothetical protein WCF85_03925 [Rhodospirillaceae bacterium]
MSTTAIERSGVTYQHLAAAQVSQHVDPRGNRERLSQEHSAAKAAVSAPPPHRGSNLNISV